MTEEPGETNHLIRFVSSETPTRFPAVQSSAGQTKLGGQSLQGEIELLPERFQLAKIEPGLNNPHHLSR